MYSEDVHGLVAALVAVAVLVITGFSCLSYVLVCAENCQPGDRGSAHRLMVVALLGLVPTIAYVIAAFSGSRLAWALLAVTFGVYVYWGTLARA